MDFTRRIELDVPYDDAIPRVKDALKNQGFGVLTEIDVRRTLKAGQRIQAALDALNSA